MTIDTDARTEATLRLSIALAPRTLAKLLYNVPPSPPATEADPPGTIPLTRGPAPTGPALNTSPIPPGASSSFLPLCLTGDVIGEAFMPRVLPSTESGHLKVQADWQTVGIGAVLGVLICPPESGGLHLWTKLRKRGLATHSCFEVEAGD